MNPSNIMRSDDLRAQNRHRILETLRQEGPLSRAEIGDRTGLSQAALSTLFGHMTDQGIVTSENDDKTKQKRGRPRTTVALKPTAALAVTVALTIDQLTFCLVDYAGKNLKQKTLNIDTLPLTEKQLCKAIVTGINQILKDHNANLLRAICIGFQGVTDVSDGVLLWSPILSIEKVPISALLKKHFGVPIVVNNDCGLIAKALHQQRPGDLGESFATLLLSHGIGLGIYLGGEPFTGAHSSALELGHVGFEKNGALCRCGKQGCIEAYASNYGIVRTANQLPPNSLPQIDVTDDVIAKLVEAVEKNKKAETQAFDIAGEAIGFGLATVFTLIDPIPVALVGSNKKAIEMLQTRVEAALSDVHRGSDAYRTPVYCYNDKDTLLHDGLVLEAMVVVDKVFAKHTDDSLDSLVSGSMGKKQKSTTV